MEDGALACTTSAFACAGIVYEVGQDAVAQVSWCMRLRNKRDLSEVAWRMRRHRISQGVALTSRQRLP